MQKYIFIILLSFIACQEKKKSEPIDVRYIVFNLYIGKNLASHSITLDFKDKSVFVGIMLKLFVAESISSLDREDYPLVSLIFGLFDITSFMIFIW